MSLPVRFAWTNRRSRTYPPPTLDTFGRPVGWAPSSDTGIVHWGYEQVVVGTTDVTFLRGGITKVLSRGRAEPFGSTVAELAFPQISEFDHIGAGDLAFLVFGARVTIWHITPTLARGAELFCGQVISWEDGQSKDGTELRVHVRGLLFAGQSAQQLLSFRQEPRDIGSVIGDALDGVISRPYGPTIRAATGILTTARGGGTTPVEFVNTLLGTATTPDGSNQWTVLAYTGGVPVIHLKDRTTVHWTLHTGQEGLDVSGLTLDVTQAPTTIYGEGVDSTGCRWFNWKFPNLHPDDSTPYPNTNPGQVITVGDTDASTDSGDGVSAIQRRLTYAGYPVAVTGTYTSTDANAIRQFQASAGLLVDGIVGGQTWSALFSIGANSGDLAAAYQAPLASLSAVEPRLRTANGSDAGANPGYVPGRPRVERYETMGSGIAKADGVRSATAELARDSVPGWLGTITARCDPVEGSRREMAGAHNLLLRYHHGADRMLHIAEAVVNEDGTVRLTVDEKARDLLTIGAILGRKRDAVDPNRNTPGRQRSRHTTDALIEFACEDGAGIVPLTPVYGGLWSVIHTPFGEAGQIVKTNLRAAPATEFAVGVFGRPIEPADLVRIVGDPLAVTTYGYGALAESNAALAPFGFIQGFGSHDQPCGYGDLGKTTPSGAVPPLTGLFSDEGTWPYATPFTPWVWVALYAVGSTKISGRFEQGPTG